MVVLSGAHVVLPDRILMPGTVVIDDGRIAEIRPGTLSSGSGFAFHGHYIVPGFIDTHVHGLEGCDTLQAGHPIADMASRLPRFGVTAFCPTTMACGPVTLRTVLAQVRRARETPAPGSARVLPVHLESNFINPDFRGAQPAACLRAPRRALPFLTPGKTVEQPTPLDDGFDAADILREIERARPDVGIVTLAPELDGAIDLVEWLVSRGVTVSMGHSVASFEEASAAIAAGARRATHLFNRMAPLHHRAPGLAGAVLDSQEVAAELICDGFHVHPALLRTAVAAKGPSRIMAVTDGTAAAGLPVGSRTMLGGQTVTVGAAAFLNDGTLAGSVVTLDRAFALLVRMGFSPVDAAIMCATTPARELGLIGYGLIARDAVADLVVLDAELAVVQTYVGGRLAYSRPANAPALASV